MWLWRAHLTPTGWERLVLVALLSLSLSLMSGSLAISQPVPPRSQPTSTRFIDRLYELSGGIFQFRPAVRVYRRGNLEYAYISLDGYELYPVAVEVLPVNESEARVRPIVQRVEYLQNNLRQIVALEYLPFQLEVTTEPTGEEVAILVSNPGRFPPQEVGRVTQADARLWGQELAEIAEIRVEIVRRALIRARAQRTPPYLQAQARKMVAIALVALVSSWLLARVQRLLLTKMKRLMQYQPLPAWPQPPSRTSQADEEQPKPSWLELFPRLGNQLHGQSTKQKLNTLARELMRIVQVTIWMGGVVWILKLYPYSRDVGQWLLNLPLRMMLFVFVVILARRAIDFLIDIGISSWVDRSILSGLASRRHIKRSPSLSIAYKTLTQAVAITTVATMLLFEVFRLPALPLVTVAGIVGFVSKNLIQDYLNGIAILWEDQYAIGDVVTINGFTGYVEYINLRVTKLRSLDGELISISNRLIETVQNLTNHWSRLNLGIDVAYGTDLDAAISVINEVAQTLRQDSNWSEIILEDPFVLGVDQFGDSGITIRLLITTQPMRQWDVGRELRLRLKKSFDEAGITIPFPQQSVWIETPRPNDSPEVT